MRNLALAALVAFAATAVPVVSQAAAPVAGGTYYGVINQTVDSGSAYVGMPVSARNVTSASGATGGAKLYGTVTAVQHAGQGRPARLQVTFTKMVMSDGSTYAVDGVVTGMQAQTRTNAAKEAGGAVAGMLIGNAIGKTIFHAGGGGVVGAIGGFLVAKNNRQNMAIAAGTTVTVHMLSVRRQSRR